MKKLEDKGFYWDYSLNNKLTNDVPYDAICIYVYDDKTITYSKVKRYDANTRQERVY